MFFGKIGKYAFIKNTCIFSSILPPKRTLPIGKNSIFFSLQKRYAVLPTGFNGVFVPNGYLNLTDMRLLQKQHTQP